MDLRLCLTLCFLTVSTGVTTWSLTSPVVSSGGDIFEYKDVLLLCLEQNIVLTTPKFDAFKHTGRSCYPTYTGPAGFLQKITEGKLETSTDGSTWSSVPFPSFNWPSKVNPYYHYFGTKNTYVICGSYELGTYPKTHATVQCAVSSDLKAWKVSKAYDQGLGYPQFVANDTVVITQSQWTPDNITMHYNGFQMHFNTLEWAATYAVTRNMRKGPYNPYPQMFSSIEDGWLAQEYDSKDGYVQELFFTRDFEHFEGPLLPISEAKVLLGSFHICSLSDGTYVIGGYSNEYFATKTPLVKKSWTHFPTPHLSHHSSNLDLHCITDGAVMHNDVGAIYVSHFPHINTWKSVYNGITDTPLGITTSYDGATFYVPTTSGAAWSSTDKGMKWSVGKKAVIQPVSFFTFHDADKKRTFYATNGTWIFSTTDWVSFTAAQKVPLEAANSYDGCTSLTVFKNHLFMVYNNQSRFGISDPQSIILSTPLPFHASSRWTKLLSLTTKIDDDDLVIIAGDDETGFLVASGEGELFMSHDGVKWESIKFLGEFDTTVGLASGLGKIMAIFRTSEENFKTKEAVYQIHSNGVVQQLHGFGSEFNQQPSLGCHADNCLLFNERMKQFYFTYQTGEIGLSGNFSTVTKLSIPNTPSYDIAALAGETGKLVAVFYAYGNGGNVYVEH